MLPQDDEYDKGFSKDVHKHVKDVGANTKLNGRTDHKYGIGISATANGLVHQPGSFEVYLEVNDSLFFFYQPSTIVRWPKPVTGETKNFHVRIGRPDPREAKPEVATQNNLNLLSDTPKVPFSGEFIIDTEGRLFIIPKAGAPIDIVFLGNPGPELGVNTNC